MIGISKADVNGLRKRKVRYGRILLREFEWHDCAALTQWGKHTDPLYALYNRPSQINEWYRRFFTYGRQSGSIRFAVENESRRIVGYLTLFQIESRQRKATLGINFDVNYINQGYGTEALSALLSVYFEYGFEELWLEVIGFNLRAIRCYQKCGFEIAEEMWDSESKRCSLDVFGDVRFLPVRDFFRHRNNKLEALKYLMVAKMPKKE